MSEAKRLNQVEKWLERLRNYCESTEDLEAYNGVAFLARSAVPTGQVAKDVARVRAKLTVGHGPEHAALHRLAAAAEQAEMAITVIEALRSGDREAMEQLARALGWKDGGPGWQAALDEVGRIRDERDAYRDSLIEAARFEMDWAFQDGNSPGYNNQKAQNYGRQANEFRLRAEKAEAERDAALRRAERAEARVHELAAAGQELSAAVDRYINEPATAPEKP